MDREQNQKKKVTRVYQMTPETAMHFFLLVKWSTDHGVPDNVHLRNYILHWLAENDQMLSVYDTKRTEEQVISDYKKQGLKVDDRRLTHVPSRSSKIHESGVMARLQRALERVVKFFTD